MVDPNTGDKVDDWRCSDAWTPMLLLEIAKQARTAGKETEAARNETVRTHDETAAILREVLRVGATQLQLSASRPASPPLQLISPKDL